MLAGVAALLTTIMLFIFSAFIASKLLLKVVILAILIICMDLIPVIPICFSC